MRRKVSSRVLKKKYCILLNRVVETCDWSMAVAVVVVPKQILERVIDHLCFEVSIMATYDVNHMAMAYIIITLKDWTDCNLYPILWTTLFERRLWEEHIVYLYNCILNLFMNSFYRLKILVENIWKANYKVMMHIVELIHFSAQQTQSYDNQTHLSSSIKKICGKWKSYVSNLCLNTCQ